MSLPENALNPKGKLHKKILDGVRERKRLAKNKMGDRYTVWADMEKQATAYVKETALSAKKRLLREDGYPQYTTVVYPFSVAIQLTALTYWAAVFLGRNPIFQYTARHGEGQKNVLAVEALIDYQMNVGKALVPMYVWLSDVSRYGVGILGTYWDEDVAQVSTYEEVEDEVMGIPTGKKRRVRNVNRLVTFEGNRLFNVRPQDFYFDPRVSLVNFQKGEFCGRYLEVGWNTILKNQRSEDNPEGYVNVDELRSRRKKGMGQWDRDPGSGEIPIPDSSATLDLTRDMGYLHLDEMCIELSPSEWNLGSQDYPEKWVFTLAENELVIGARPLGEFHNQFPYNILTTEIEGHGIWTRSMLEMEKPLNDVLTWLLNTHFYNVRKAMNDMFIVDPDKVEMQDLLDPEPGKLIRLKPSFAGTDVRTVIQQFQVVDVTQNHIRDMQVVMDIMQRLQGTNDTVMGQVNPGGRKSATEIRSSSSFSVNRLKTIAEYMSALGFQPLGQMLVQASQQHYDGEREFRIAGNMVQDQKFAMVDPESIAGFYDFVPVDGTFPIDRFAQANLWRQILADMAQNPYVAQQYDPGAVFAWLAKLEGIKNLDQFKREIPLNFQAMPDGQVAGEAKKGNLVPMPQPKQMAGVGPLL